MRSAYFLTTFVVFGFVFLCVTASAQAQSFTITCQSEACSMEPENAALFQESDMLPGESRYGTFLIHNAQKKEGCQISLRAERTTPAKTPDLATQLQIVLSDAYWVYLDGTTFATLFENTTSPIGIVDADTTSLYTWETTFAQAAGDEYQGASFKYDFSLDIVCDKSIKAPKPPKPPKSPQPSKKPKQNQEQPRSTAATETSLTPLTPTTERPNQQSLLERIGSVLGIATAAATPEDPPTPQSSATTVLKLIPFELQQLSQNTKYLLLTFYLVLSGVILFLLYLLLFRRKRHT